MSVSSTTAPATDDGALERLEAALLRSPSATWPVAPATVAAPVDVSWGFVPDDDEDGSEPGMTLIRTRRYCCL